jgi:hypothetical protein
MIMVTDKNENFRIYLIRVFIQTQNKKVEKMGGVRKFLKFHERGSWDEKVWEPLTYRNAGSSYRSTGPLSFTYRRIKHRSHGLSNRYNAVFRHSEDELGSQGEITAQKRECRMNAHKATRYYRQSLIRF